MSKNWFKITAQIGQTPAQIDIFDEIGYWGVSAKQFVNQLRAIGSASAITLNIDCPGGDCEDGFTIFDAIKAHGAPVTANITGTAASMASVIMLAAQTINIAPNARVMIHRVNAFGGGNPDDLQAVTDLAKKFEDRIVNLYVARTGKKEKAVRDLMNSQMGTWMFGQEAVDEGFADAVLAGTTAKAFNLAWAPKFPSIPGRVFDTKSTPTPPANSTAPTMTAKEIAQLEANLAAAQKAVTDAKAKAAAAKNAKKKDDDGDDDDPEDKAGKKKDDDDDDDDPEDNAGKNLSFSQRIAAASAILTGGKSGPADAAARAVAAEAENKKLKAELTTAETEFKNFQATANKRIGELEGEKNTVLDQLGALGVPSKDLPGKTKTENGGDNAKDDKQSRFLAAYNAETDPMKRADLYARHFNNSGSN